MVTPTNNLDGLARMKPFISSIYDHLNNSKAQKNFELLKKSCHDFWLFTSSVFSETGSDTGHWPEISLCWVNPDHFSSTLEFQHMAQLSLSTLYDLTGFRLADVGGW